MILHNGIGLLGATGVAATLGKIHFSPEVLGVGLATGRLMVWPPDQETELMVDQ